MSRDERLRAFESLRVPATAPLSHATVIRVGQIVGAARVIIGSAAISGEMLTVRARSILLDGGQISTEVVETGRSPTSLPSTVASPNVSLSGCRVRLPRTSGPSTRGGIRAIHQRTAGRGTGDEALVFARGAAAVAHARAGAYRDVGRPQCAGRAPERACRCESGALPTHPLAREARFLSTVSLIQLERHEEAFDALTDLNRRAVDGSLLNNLGVVQLRAAGCRRTRAACGGVFHRRDRRGRR